MKLTQLAKHCLWTIMSLTFTGFVLLGCLYYYFSLSLPDIDHLKTVQLQVPLKVYSSDGKLISSYGEKRRVPATLDEIPEQLVHAVLATEDQRYYEHIGVDFIGLVRAAKEVLTTGRKSQGASTITMQVARNFFLSRKKTYTRKLNEILLAMKIDRALSKQKILELYLNKIYFGQRAYGVAAAAQVYYGKSLSELTLPEMAMIAGLPKAPSRDNPISNPTAAKERRNHVLGRMVEAGYINDATYQTAISAPITAKTHALRSELNAPYVAEMVRTAMVEEYGDEAYTRGINVYTTLESTLQETANNAIRDGLRNYTQRHGYHHPSKNLGYPSDLQTWQQFLATQPIINGTQAAAIVSVHQHSASAMLADGQLITIPWSGLSWARPYLDKKHPGPAPRMAGEVVTLGDVVRVYEKNPDQWSLTQLPKAQAALISMNPNNGSIKALVGGFSYTLSHFNRATQAERQPGSIFKPFIYSAALAKGLTLATTINDAPVVIKNTTTNELWRPHNDNLTFYGPTRLAVGLMKSRNLVSIRLLQLIGIPYTLNYVERFGFASGALPNTLSLALGSGIVTPMQVSTGFATFANGGYSVKPFFIDHIEDENGINLYQANPITVCKENCSEGMPVASPVITAQNAYLMRHALENVVRFGTGRRARSLNRDDIAGKTGTTNDQVDAWFAGFNSDVVTTVWVGYDQPKSLHEYGSQAALPIWIDFMKVALKDQPLNHPMQPNDIITARIDPASGLLARAGQKNAIFELFREEYAPIDSAPYEQHAAISLDSDTDHPEEAVIPEQLF